MPVDLPKVYATLPLTCGTRARVVPQYKNLGAIAAAAQRFDPEKAQILRKWKLDKSCKWVSSYYQEMAQEKSAKSKELEGHGTRLSMHPKHVYKTKQQVGLS